MPEQFLDQYPHLKPALGEEPPLAALGPGCPREPMRTKLAALDLAVLFAGRPINDASLARCCQCGMWLAFDFLDESHRISQEIDTLEGSYWHGIMHRREPDYLNAKYWFRRVPRHPFFEPLLVDAQALVEKHRSTDPHASFLLHDHVWNATKFVDLCEAVARGEAQCQTLAQEIARAEWRRLFDFCYEGALA